MANSPAVTSRALPRFAWFFVAYLLFVILFGAWVRITHSGAGCGSHWPTCDGQVLPDNPDTAMVIEFSHRLTSGLCGILGLFLVAWVWRRHRTGKELTAALATLALIIVEALIGAGLVLGELVADDASAARAIVIALHLTNTLMLMSAATLTAWWTGGAPAVQLRSRLASAFALGLALLVLTSMAGAVTALGDTLFPTGPALGPELFAKLSADASPANHFLVRLRAVHPLIAVASALYLFWLFTRRPSTWATVGLLTLTAELVIGVMNIALGAPGWIQLVHLALANVLWISTLLAGISALSQPEIQPVASARLAATT